MGVKIIVCVKTNLDVEMVRVRNREPVLEAIPYKVGNLDKNGLEAAIQIKERGAEVTVVALTVAESNGRIKETVKEVLAIGADEAVIVSDSGLTNTDQAGVATTLAAAVQHIGGADLLLFGEGSTDNYSGQVGARVAEILGMPQIGYARKVELAGPGVRAERIMDEMVETLEAPLPAVVTVVSEINEPRIPSLMNIMKAGKKPVLELSSATWAWTPHRSPDRRRSCPTSRTSRIESTSCSRVTPLLRRPASSTHLSEKGSSGGNDGGDPCLQRQVGARSRAGLSGQAVRPQARAGPLRRCPGRGSRRHSA